MLSSFQLTPSTSPDLLYQFPNKPKNCLLIKKPNSTTVSGVAAEIAQYLTINYDVTIYVEKTVYLSETDSFHSYLPYTPSNHRHIIDFAITIGGDGTALYFNSLFHDSFAIPPLISFSMGTLGFLTPFETDQYRTILDRVMKAYKREIKPKIYRNENLKEIDSKKGEDSEEDDESEECVLSLCPRMRLYCQVWKKRTPEPLMSPTSTYLSPPSSPAPPTPSPPPTEEEEEVYLDSTFHPLNEVLISRHTSPFLTSIELGLIQENGETQKVSTVQADGLIVSTATGSTAYSMSAGGPMVSPNTHCIILTPVCPHTLSFRPIILPDSTRLQLSIAPQSRSPVGLLVFDGHAERPITKGEWVTIRQDTVPLFSVNYVHPVNLNDGVDSTVLWFRSISCKLNWNVRESPPSTCSTALAAASRRASIDADFEWKLPSSSSFNEKNGVSPVVAKEKRGKEEGRMNGMIRSGSAPVVNGVSGMISNGISSSTSASPLPSKM